MFISLNETRFSLKYFFALRHHEQVEVLNKITFGMVSPSACWHFTTRQAEGLSLALVELGEPHAGLPYLRVVRIVAQIPVRFGRQGHVLRLRITQPHQ